VEVQLNRKCLLLAQASDSYITKRGSCYQACTLWHWHVYWSL